MDYLRKLAKAMLILVLIAVAFVIPELLSRVLMPAWAPGEDSASLWEPNIYTGWRQIPSNAANFDPDGWVGSNALGLRDKQLGEKTKPRILFLGDSFTHGFGIKNGERFTAKLQPLLPNYQIINAGVLGFGTLQEFFLLKLYADAIQPDYIVLQMYKNDFIDNLDTKGMHPHPYLDWQNQFALTNYPVPKMPLSQRFFLYLLKDTYFYRQLAGQLFLFSMKLHIEFKPDEIPEPQQKDLIQGMQIALPMIYDLCAKKHISIILFAHDLEPYQQSVVQSLSSAHAVPYYNLDEAFIKATQDIRYRDGRHWNVYGNQLVANYMYPRIVSMTSVAR